MWVEVLCAAGAKFWFLKPRNNKNCSTSSRRFPSRYCSFSALALVEMGGGGNFYCRPCRVWNGVGFSPCRHPPPPPGSASAVVERRRTPRATPEDRNSKCLKQNRQHLYFLTKDVCTQQYTPGMNNVSEIPQNILHTQHVVFDTEMLRFTFLHRLDKYHTRSTLRAKGGATAAGGVWKFATQQNTPVCWVHSRALTDAYRDTSMCIDHAVMRGDQQVELQLRSSR